MNTVTGTDLSHVQVGGVVPADGVRLLEGFYRSLELLEVQIAQPFVVPNFPVFRVDLSAWDDAQEVTFVALKSWRSQLCKCRNHTPLFTSFKQVLLYHSLLQKLRRS